MPSSTFELRFGDRSVRAAQTTRLAELPSFLEELGLVSPQPTLVVVGGAGGLTGSALAHLRPLCSDVVVPLAAELGVAVVTGGTDSGVMRLLGRSRAALGVSFPLIGVAAIDTVQVPGRSPAGEDPAPLEPNHTCFVLVPGRTWGEESWWLAAVATRVAGGAPSATVVVNGGRITYEDVEHSLAAGRAVLVADGTGRTADQLAAAIRGEDTDQRAVELAASAPGLLQSVDVAPPATTAAFAGSLRALLGQR